jgi:N-terminal domain of anti-restriction factor ArdC
MTATIDREQIQQEALSRAVSGQTLSNWPAIIRGFVAKGIPEQDIRPRENVFTYHAWRALGRQVRRGEHGVKVITYVTIKGKEDKDGVATNDLDGTDKPARGATRRPWSATVFHVSQTDPIQ